MKFIGIYYCPLVGYIEVYPIIASSRAIAEAFMEKGLNDFIIENEHEIIKNEDYYDDEDIEYFNYTESCYWELVEANDFYLNLYNLDIINEDEWQNIEGQCL